MRWSPTQKQKDAELGREVHVHHPLDCSGCGAALLDVKVRDPGFDLTIRYKAECPFCGDSSFPVTVKGIGISIGSTDRVCWDGETTVGDLVVLKTARGKVGAAR